MLYNLSFNCFLSSYPLSAVGIIFPILADFICCSTFVLIQEFQVSTDPALLTGLSLWFAFTTRIVGLVGLLFNILQVRCALNRKWRLTAVKTHANWWYVMVTGG